jgi:hypothetical protein
MAEFLKEKFLHPISTHPGSTNPTPYPEDTSSKLFRNVLHTILQLGPCIFKLRRNKSNEMHIQSKVNHIFRISMLFLHVSALYERHIQGAQRILMKLCVCYVISAELSEGREWIPSVYCQSIASVLSTTHRRYPLPTFT